MAVAGVEAKLLANTVPYCILNRFLPTSSVEWTYSLVTQPIPCFLISDFRVCFPPGGWRGTFFFYIRLSNGVFVFLLPFTVELSSMDTCI